MSRKMVLMRRWQRWSLMFALEKEKGFISAAIFTSAEYGALFSKLMALYLVFLYYLSRHFCIFNLCNQFILQAEAH